MIHPEAQAVLDFWFSGASEPFWFKKSADFDRELMEKFGETLARGHRGELADWRSDMRGRLAEIIVLDQFSRNVYRDTPEAFSADGMALVLAQEAIKLPDFAELSERERHFLLMPYMHSESLAIHEEAVWLFGRYVNEFALDFERKHKVIIERFGRYPHRNAILGRVSSEAELVFLTEPNSSF